MSPGLRRARAPFRLRNAITGIALGAFAVGIWSYSISAVKQDAFDDIDDEARALQAGRLTSASRDQVTVGNATSSPEPTSSPADVPIPVAAPQKGILRHLESRFPNLLDPRSKTLVSGAPPIDNMGTISRS
jgi:cytochrome c oxidase assembly factor 3